MYSVSLRTAAKIQQLFKIVCFVHSFGTQPHMPTAQAYFLQAASDCIRTAAEKSKRYRTKNSVQPPQSRQCPWRHTLWCGRIRPPYKADRITAAC